MKTGFLSGLPLIVLGGVLQGTFALPMKYARRWNHENIWLVFAFTGLVLFPWLLAVMTIPALADVYRFTPAATTVAILGFGAGWGIGATLTGIGLRLLGISLGLGIILGLSASIGSLVPFLVFHPEQLFSSRGYFYLAGTLTMFVGIGLIAKAGSLRERLAQEQTSGLRKSFAPGLAACVASGVLSSALNFSFAFGAPMVDRAKYFGAPDVWASNAVTAAATTGGFVANAIYCTVMLRRNKSLSQYTAAGTGSHWLYGLTMGAFWYGGLTLYALGIANAGSFGAVLGWPLLMGVIVVVSNLVGWLTGEWNEASSQAKASLFAGCAVILIALGILGGAQRG
jgi:L-rhamnose-H+ transport protein